MSTEVKLSTRDPVPEKIQARHCDRHAVVYVRQSTLRQVEQNRESTRLQYGLADRACRLGWRREQILVIDDDLGRSAASALDPSSALSPRGLAMWDWCSALRSRVWRAPAATGISSWRCARS